jgi:hypothetical protein
VVAEGGAGGHDVRRVLRLVQLLFRGGLVLLGDDIVNRLFRHLLAYCYKNIDKFNRLVFLRVGKYRNKS